MSSPSVDDKELDEILHPVRNSHYMQKYAEKHVKVLRAALVDVEEGTAVSVAEREYWQEIEGLNQWLDDQRGSLEWYTLTEGNLVRLWTDGDPLPFFTSKENDVVLCQKYGIARATDSFHGALKEGLATQRGISYDPTIHTPDTVEQITRDEMKGILNTEFIIGMTDSVMENLGCNVKDAQDILTNGRLLGYLCEDDTDVAPKMVLFAYDKHWNLWSDSPAWNSYGSQFIFVPFTEGHEAYDHVIEDLKEDMASRCDLTLREGWPKP